MFSILLIVFLFCDYQYHIEKDDTLFVDLDLPTGSQNICVNTSLEYSILIFNSLGNASFVFYDDIGNVRHLSYDESYLNVGAISFGKILGSLVITASPHRISHVTFSALSFSRETCDIKMVSNNFRDFVYLLHEKSTVCYFNGNGVNFRYSFYIPHGTLEIKGPNKTSKTIEKDTTESIDSFSPFIVYKNINDTTPNGSTSFPYIMAVGKNEVEASLPLRIISNEPCLIERANLDCAPKDQAKNESEWSYYRSLLSEKEMKNGVYIVISCLLGISFFIYLFSLCCIFPCCCCFRCCRKNCLSCCCRVDDIDDDDEKEVNEDGEINIGSKKNRRQKKFHREIDDNDQRNNGPDNLNNIRHDNIVFNSNININSNTNNNNGVGMKGESGIDDINENGEKFNDRNGEDGDQLESVNESDGNNKVNGNVNENFANQHHEDEDDSLNNIQQGERDNTEL